MVDGRRAKGRLVDPTGIELKIHLDVKVDHRRGRRNGLHERALETGRRDADGRAQQLDPGQAAAGSGAVARTGRSAAARSVGVRRVGHEVGAADVVERVVGKAAAAAGRDAAAPADGWIAARHDLLGAACRKSFAFSRESRPNSHAHKDPETHLIDRFETDAAG